MPSSNFERFHESYFGDPYMAWHDGLDEQALLSLEGDEREEAERLLTEGLKSGDYRPAAGLAALRSQGAAADLKAQLPQVTGNTLVQTALALWQIEKYPPAVPALISVLRRHPFWESRMNAARALAKVRTPASVAALRAALDDPEDLVRSHAVDAVLAMHGIQDGEFPDQMSIRIMAAGAEQRRLVVQELEQLIADKGRLLED